jgi:hypothetical protein
MLAVFAAAAPMWWLGAHAQAMRLGGEAAGWGGLILTFSAAAVAFLLFWRLAARRPAQRLRWDGTGWQLLSADVAEELNVPAVQIDLSHAVLLRARRPGCRPVWLPLERRDAPVTWHRLRVALNQPSRSTQAAPRSDGVST